MKKIALLLGSMVILAGTAQGAEKEVTPKATPVTVIEDNTLIVAPVVNETPKFRVTSITTGAKSHSKSNSSLVFLEIYVRPKALFPYKFFLVAPIYVLVDVFLYNPLSP